MTVLVCPVCAGSMKEVSKDGVLIDICTRCRGVWLDRGELEKLASHVAASPDDGRYTAAPSAAPFLRSRDRDDDDDDHRGRHYGRPQKSKMSRFMDFFD